MKKMMLLAMIFLISIANFGVVNAQELANSSKPSEMIYVPDLNYACYTVVGEGIIRAYEEVPRQDSTINYRDYYINSDYIFNDGSQRFYASSLLPNCLDHSILTNSAYYRTDFYKILIILFLMSFFIIYVPLRIFSRFGKRFFS